MFMRNIHSRPWLAAIGLLAIPLVAYAQQPPLPAADAEELTRGPIHEAFGEAIRFDPEPGEVVPKAPPAPVEEIPPDQKPEGDNVAWIPGYWSWDDQAKNFVWVSGFWRALPPQSQLGARLLDESRRWLPVGIRILGAG